MKKNYWKLALKFFTFHRLIIFNRWCRRYGSRWCRAIIFRLISSGIELMLIVITDDIIRLKLTVWCRISRVRCSQSLRVVVGGESFDLKGFSDGHESLKLRLLYIHLALVHELEKLRHDRERHIFEDYCGKQKNNDEFTLSTIEFFFHFNKSRIFSRHILRCFLNFFHIKFNLGSHFGLFFSSNWHLTCTKCIYFFKEFVLPTSFKPPQRWQSLSFIRR